MSDRKLLNIPLKQIRENKEALRKVNRQNPEYLEMVDSVRQQGILNAISVRELKDPVTDETYYAVIDGLHRFTAAKDVGLETIPASILEMSDGDVLEAQVLANIHKVETKPVEYSKQLVRILSSNPTMTKASLCVKLAKSPAWLEQRLGLTKLDPNIAKLVDDQTLTLTNAYMLSKLEEEDQRSFLDKALSQSPSEFIPTVNNRIKEVKDAKRKGRDPNKPDFIPSAFMRKPGEAKAELENPTETLKAIDGLTDPKEIVKRVLEWVFNVDPAGIESQRRKHEEMKVQKEVEKKKREEDREKAKREKAAVEAAALPI